MTEYEILGTSDPTAWILVPDWQIAVIAIALLGGGQHVGQTDRADRRESAPDVPMFRGGFAAFWESAWPGSDGFGPTVEARRSEVVAALRSVAAGPLPMRNMYRLTCAAIGNPRKLQTFRAEWITSWSATNNIMGRALALADWIEDAP